jgi:hypothetical protein
MESGEEMAFPWLFCQGVNGYNFPRQMKILRAMYFKQRLYHRHGYFRKDMTYLLHAAVNTDLMLLKSEININMRITKSTQNSDFVTAFDVKNLQQNSKMSKFIHVYEKY